MAPARAEGEGFDVALTEVPVTEQRLPFIQQGRDEKLRQPGQNPEKFQ
jgi:hypothetical protein